MGGKFFEKAIQAWEEETPFDDVNLNVLGCWNKLELVGGPCHGA